jgi:hypothetical protein
MLKLKNGGKIVELKEEILYPLMIPLSSVLALRSPFRVWSPGGH